MKDTLQIRMATRQDARRILEIYTPYIMDTVITFEYEVPSIENFMKRMEQVLEKFPYLVAVENETIIGYAYASPYKDRAAYDWSVETSIYMDKEHHGKGAGTMLYAKLFELLKKQGIRNVYACVTLPNEKSEALHGKFGFALVGRFHHAGYKFDEWHDVGWFELSLERSGEKPVPVVPVNQVSF